MINPLTKMHGLGNTFVVLMGPLSPEPYEVIELCSAYGEEAANGLIIVSPVDVKTVSMKYWNSDGSPAEMCGNGLRCAVRFSVDNGIVAPGSFCVQTDAGILEAIWDGKNSDRIEVQVGRPVYDDERHVEGYRILCGSIGNPHAVIFVDDIDSVSVEHIGFALQNSIDFPDGVNVNFVQRNGTHTIKIRTWERGCGETQACGTGMAFSAAAASRTRDVVLPVVVEARGGSAKVWIDDSGFMRMIGPAKLV